MKIPSEKSVRSRSYRINLSLIKLDNQSYHIITEGIINQLPVNLVIDTGASRSVFNREYFEDHLNPDKSSEEELHSAGISAEKIEVVFAKADTFVLGVLKIRDYPMALINLNKINKLYMQVAGINIHGLIGSDFLRDMNAVIDFGRSVMILKPENI